jgi:hypothetical protein
MRNSWETKDELKKKHLDGTIDFREEGAYKIGWLGTGHF